MLWRVLLDDVVVASPYNDLEPFAVSGGATMWDLLEEPRTIQELADVLGDPAAADRLSDLLSNLAEAGVVTAVES